MYLVLVILILIYYDSYSIFKSYVQKFMLWIWMLVSVGASAIVYCLEVTL